MSQHLQKSINPSTESFLYKKALLTLDQYVEGIRSGNKVILGQAITLVESTLPAHQMLANGIIEACLPFSTAQESLRIGITGTPGVGKSTFIESLGLFLIEKKKKIAVLAIDPSSQNTRGSILGDKTRMGEITSREEVFIRPSPAGTSLGGVARKTRETIILCEAAGYDTIIVETVGVGQSEIAVHSMVDLFLLLLLPGAGDELQGIKRGIVEMADILTVNKADGDRLALAKQAQKEYKNALHLMPPKSNGWSPEVLICSGLEKEGISEIWNSIESYLELANSQNSFDEKRKKQSLYWMKETIWSALKYSFYEDPKTKELMIDLEQEVLDGKRSPFSAAEQLLKSYLNKK